MNLTGNGPADDIGLLYGEDQGRVILSCRPTDRTALLALAQEHSVPTVVAGVVSEPGGMLSIVTGRTTHSWPASELRNVYFEAIPRRMRALVTDRDEGA